MLDGGVVHADGVGRVAVTLQLVQGNGVVFNVEADCFAGNPAGGGAFLEAHAFQPWAVVVQQVRVVQIDAQPLRQGIPLVIHAIHLHQYFHTAVAFFDLAVGVAAQVGAQVFLSGGIAVGIFLIAEGSQEELHVVQRGIAERMHVDTLVVADGGVDIADHIAGYARGAAEGAHRHCR